MPALVRNGSGVRSDPEMEVVYSRPDSLRDRAMHYCPGCTHGVIHRIVAEVIDELGIRTRTLLVAPVGCAVFAYDYFNLDGCGAPHGRAPAMATGLKRALPGRIVFTYQGDGDLASIGGNEILHAGVRGEKITIIFVNNGVFGMTGGQVAPTSLVGQVTASSPFGRTAAGYGYPLHMPELLATLPGVAYAVRRSVHSPSEIRRARKAIRLAFTAQMRELGLSIVELLSTCPTNWHVNAAEALEHLQTQVLPEYPLGDFKVAAGLDGGRMGE